MRVTQKVDWDLPINLGPNNMLGIGVLAYGGVHDLVRCLIHLCKNTHIPFHICVFDNTEKNKTNIKVVHSLNDSRISVIDSPKNVGCSVSRNQVYFFFKEKYPGLKYFAFLDQDVMVHDQWASNMISVMQAYEQAGIVAWPQANIGKVPVRSDGCTSMVSSCCNMHRVDAVEDVRRLFGGPWDERFFFYRFDSLFAQRNNQSSWRTYLCLKYYRLKVAWLDQTGGISHPKPNSGVKRNPKWKEIRAKSDRLYKKIKAEEKWVEYDPMKEPISMGN